MLRKGLEISETRQLGVCEFVGLRAKMYSFVLDGGKEKKTAKGVKKGVTENEIRHKDDKDCLFSQRSSLRN